MNPLGPQTDCVPIGGVLAGTRYLWVECRCARIIHSFPDRAAAERFARVPAAQPPTERQLALLKFLDDGLTLVEIAKGAQLDDPAMRREASDLRHALGARTNAQAVGIAHRRGWL